MLKMNTLKILAVLNFIQCTGAFIKADLNFAKAFLSSTRFKYTEKDKFTEDLILPRKIKDVLPYKHPYDEINKAQKCSLASVLNIPSTYSLDTFQRPKVVGHRGALYMEPENTLRGFQISSEIGCDSVELDVFLLKCGTLIVFHGGGSDENPGCLLNYCGIKGNILDYSYTEARKLVFNSLGQEYACPREKISGEHAFIPTLREVLEDAKVSGLGLKIELKGPNTAEPVLQLVEEMDMVEQCQFSSFDLNQISRIRELRPEKNLNGKHKYKTGALFKENLPDNYIELSLNAGASQVHLKYDTCTVERIKEIHNYGMDSMAWFRGPNGMKEDITEKYFDVGNEDNSMYWAVISTGVRELCVNKPHVLLKLLEEVEIIRIKDT